MPQHREKAFQLFVGVAFTGLFWSSIFCPPSQQSQHERKTFLVAYSKSILSYQGSFHQVYSIENVNIERSFFVTLLTKALFFKKKSITHSSRSEKNLAQQVSRKIVK